MKVNMELDGEPISIEQSSPSDRTTGLNVREDFPTFNDSFNNADGMINHADAEGRIRMVVASAAQNTPNYFDQDNFYPADGMRDRLKKGSQQRKESRKVKSEDRRNVRLGKKEAKTSEIQSRADLNREVGKDKQSDIELAKALQGGDEKAPMSTTTKVLIGAGILAVVGAIAFFVIKKKK
jgi:hypothetical protein